MNHPDLSPALAHLASQLQGELHTSHAMRVLYATDASVYRKLPLAVALPSHEDDLLAIVRFANEHKIGIIPRTAGTSLAGQAVGEGLVVDFSVHFNNILEINEAERWVRVQPGVIRDELNRALLPLGLWFSPNTSTASRCMIGGMVGNNSSGTTSIRYGVTRDKVLEAKVILSDGSTAHFGSKSAAELEEITSKQNLEASIYNHLLKRLSTTEVAQEIVERYPKPGIHRRNTGYALDMLLHQKPFATAGDDFNLAKLITGSEGTLCLTTEVKLSLDFLPPVHEAVVCAHFESLQQAMLATVEVMKQMPYACELMDKTILDCTKGNLNQIENRFFVEGDPGAILAIELRDAHEEGLNRGVESLITALTTAGLGYAFPVIRPPDTSKVWDLRAAGLGVLSNVKGDAKPIAFVEDTAVEVADLPGYINDFDKMMGSFGQRAVYYAHAGAGELHVRPVLNLKSKEGQQQFRAIGTASAKLVATYGGSLSGEHGDGRARSEFIPMVLGERNYALIKEVKQVWDPSGIFNPGNIVDALPMDADFRYAAGQQAFKGSTFLDFSDKGNLLLAAEACNGSGDCRKPHQIGATMCPSYQATSKEQDSTRARANMLREVLTKPDNPVYPMGSDALHEVLDLCLSCKACKRECPSSVDMALMKAEADYHYYRRNGWSLRAKFFGHFHRNARWAALAAPIVNGIMGSAALAGPLKRQLGIAGQRSLPGFSWRTAQALAAKYQTKKQAEFVLYLDEFTQYQDAKIAAAAAELFSKLGYRFELIYAPSARAYMSKAMLSDAKLTIERSMLKLRQAVEASLPIVGLEPSAILGFRDDLQALFSGKEKESIKAIGALAMTFEEFLAAEADKGRVGQQHFKVEQREVQLHLHCHQKALSHVKFSKRILSLPQGYKVTAIPSGCCGMAGSFGYEAEHYDISMQIGEMVLFPRVRSLAPNVIIAAAGTSCRHQIVDGTGREAMHPAEILRDALL